MMSDMIPKPVKESLQKAVDLIHRNGYVHGDLRPCTKHPSGWRHN